MENTFFDATNRLLILIENGEIGLDFSIHHYFKILYNFDVLQANDKYTADKGFGIPLAIALDTKGPEIRTGKLEGTFFVILRFKCLCNYLKPVERKFIYNLKKNPRPCQKLLQSKLAEALFLKVS